MLLSDIKNVSNGLYILKDTLIVDITGGWVLDGDLSWDKSFTINKLFSSLGVYIIKSSKTYKAVLVEDVKSKVIKVRRISELHNVYEYLGLIDDLVARLGSSRTLYTLCDKLLKILNLDRELKLILYNSTNVIGILDKISRLIRLYDNKDIHKNLGSYTNDIVYKNGSKLFVTERNKGENYLIYIDTTKGVNIITLDGYLGIKIHLYNSIVIECKDYTLLFVVIHNRLYYSVVKVKGITKGIMGLDINLTLCSTSDDLYGGIDYLTAINNKEVSIIGVGVSHEYKGINCMLDGIDIIYKDSYIMVVNRE